MVGLVNNKPKPEQIIAKFKKLESLSNFDPNISKKSMPDPINKPLESDSIALKKHPTFINLNNKTQLSHFLNQAKSFEGPSHIVEMGDQTLYIGIIGKFFILLIYFF